MVLLTPKHGSAKPPSIPGVAPKIVVQDKEYSQSEFNMPTTALDLLKTRLGEDAHLLDHIPLNEVIMVTGDQMFSLSPHRICVGLGRVQGQNQSCKIWAFVSEKARQDGSIDIKLYGEDKEGRMHQHSLEEMNRSDQWLDMFDVGQKNKTTVLIKCCFAMKGVPLPKDLTFSDGFLTTLKRICRYYMERSQSVFIPSMGAKAKSVVPSQSPYKGAMVARKSEPRGSSVQLFSLLPTASVQTSNGNNVQKTARFDSDPPTTSARVSVGSGTLDQKKSDDTSELSLLMRESLPQTTQVTSSPKKTSTTRSQATGISSRAGSSAVSINDIDRKTSSALRSPKGQFNSQNSSKQLSARPVTPVSAASRNTAVMAKASQASKHEHAQQASTSGLAGYQTLQGQILEMERRLEHIEVDAQENKVKYDGLREEKKHSIDVLMKERHQAEIKLMLKQLEQKHKAERAVEKNEYDSLVEEYRAHKDMIEKQREQALQRRETAKQELKRKREGLSREDLLECLDACDERDRSQKRRKI